MKAVNIQWDIDINEAITALDEMPAEKAAKAIELSYDRYANMTTEERHDYAYDFFHHRPAALEEFMNLPNEVEIPTEITEEEDIANWLSDTYGFCHAGFELDKAKYVLIINGDYYAGPNQKYADMYNLSGSGPIGAKLLSAEEAVKMQHYLSGLGNETSVEPYNPHRYLRQSLEKIIQYEQRRRKGYNPGYAIENTAKYCLEYLKQIPYTEP